MSTRANSLDSASSKADPNQPWADVSLSAPERSGGPIERHK